MAGISEKFIQLEVSDGTAMQVFAVRPESPVKAGILVFQEAFGVNGHIQEVTRRVAREGYLVVAPELFHRTLAPGGTLAYPSNNDFSHIQPHIQAVTREGLLADFQGAYDWLTNEIKTDVIGCVGFCMGGSSSFIANSKLPLKAAVSYYGTRILQNLDLIPEQKGPLLLLWGGKDKGTPSEKIKELIDGLKAAGKDFITTEFSEAAHAFNCDERPSYHAASAATAWAMTLAFFKQHLK